MSDDVLISTNPDTRTGAGVFHPDESCHYAQNGTMRPVPRSHAVDEMGLRECANCADTTDRSHPGETLAFNVDELDIPPLD